jgi:hypothetical protein
VARLYFVAWHRHDSIVVVALLHRLSRGSSILKFATFVLPFLCFIVITFLFRCIGTVEGF